MQPETQVNTCSVCQTVNHDDASFCKACGASLRSPTTCPSCGTGVPKEARFCPGCGLRLIGRRPLLDAIKPVEIPAATTRPQKTDIEAEAQAEIIAAKRTVAKRSNITVNLLFFVAGLAVILVVIREMNLGKPAEMNPFNGPPPASMGQSATPQNSAPTASGPSESDIVGTVELGPDIKSAPNGTLFVIARIKGSAERGPPVAVKRIPNPTFPASFRLGPQDVMLKEMPFTGPFDIRARLDADGNVMTKAPGDLMSSTPTEANPGTSDIKVMLDTRR